MHCILLRNYVFFGWGYDLGCRPNPLGDVIPKPHLPLRGGFKKNFKEKIEHQKG